MSFILQVASFLGAAMILLAYVAAQTGLFRISFRARCVLNAVGSILVAIPAARASVYSVVLLEGVWALVSFRSLWRGPLAQGTP
jgi:hypothetical protein